MRAARPLAHQSGRDSVGGGAPRQPFDDGEREIDGRPRPLAGDHGAVGDHARIGSGAVVVKPVPADSTAVGVPARVVRGPGVQPEPSAQLNHQRLPDPVAEACRLLEERIRALEERLAALGPADGDTTAAKDV